MLVLLETRNSLDPVQRQVTDYVRVRHERQGHDTRDYVYHASCDLGNPNFIQVTKRSN